MLTSEKRYCIQPRAIKTGHREAAERVICIKKLFPNASLTTSFKIVAIMVIASLSACEVVVHSELISHPGIEIVITVKTS